MTIPFLDLQAQYRAIKSEIDGAIAAVIADCAFINGYYANTFETEFAAYQQTAHCVGVGNGTDALEIILEALDLPTGSEIIIPANTFIATSEAVARAGHTVVFCDCEPLTYTISVASARKRITGKTRAIIPVHLYGQPCDMDGLAALADEFGLKIIEDCAQAHGAEYHGKRVGTFGVAGTFSFYPGKNLGAYGDAGAIVTNSKELAIQCRMIANHGRTAKYDHQFEGRNSRMDGIQAAILSVKLRHLDAWTEARREVAARYRTLFEDSSIALPEEREMARHVYHLFVVQVDEREAVQEYLKKNSIETGIHYPIPLPMLAAYRHLGHTMADFPMLASSVNRIISLPIYPELSEDHIVTIAKTLSKAIGGL